MTYLEEVLEGFKHEVERARSQFLKPKGGQQVTPSGDFIRVPPSVIHRLEWWARALEDAVRRDRETTPQQKESEDLIKAKEEIARLKAQSDEYFRLWQERLHLEYVNRKKQ